VTSGPGTAGALVEQYFESDAAFWSDVYRRADIFSVGIQRRQATALTWVDGLGLPLQTPILEVGCGSGMLSVALAQRRLSVRALDAVAEMVARTQRRAADLGVAAHLSAGVGDVHRLEAKDATFGVVIALGVLPWLHSPAIAIREMARVLRPGGWLIVSADNQRSLVNLVDPFRNPFLDPLKQAVIRLLRRPRPAGARPRGDRRAMIDGMLAEAGLTPVARTSCGFGPLWIAGHRILPAGSGLALERRLQTLADRGVPGLRSGGWHYMVLARKAAVTS